MPKWLARLQKPRVRSNIAIGFSQRVVLNIHPGIALPESEKSFIEFEVQHSKKTLTDLAKRTQFLSPFCRHIFGVAAGCDGL
jgi:hypothetical protein